MGILKPFRSCFVMGTVRPLWVNHRDKARDPCFNIALIVASGLWNISQLVIHNIDQGREQPRHRSWTFLYSKTIFWKPRILWTKWVWSMVASFVCISVCFEPNQHQGKHNGLGIIIWSLNNTSSRLHALPVHSVSKCRP